MIKVRMLSSNQVKEVTRNEAHALIERGQAVLETAPQAPQKSQSYSTRVMTANLAKNKKMR